MSVVSTSDLSDNLSDSDDGDSGVNSSFNINDIDNDGIDDKYDPAIEPFKDNTKSSNSKDTAKDTSKDSTKDSSKDVISNDDSSKAPSSTPSSDSSSDSNVVTPEESSDNSNDCNLMVSMLGPKKVIVGKEINWNITVKNTKNNAKKVVLKEKLPSELEIVSCNANKGNYNEATGEWKIGDLKKDESASLTIKAKTKKVGNYANQATVFTESNNLNKTTTVNADFEVVPKVEPKAIAEKNKKEIAKTVNQTKDTVKKVEKVQKEKPKVNATAKKTNNETKKTDLKHAGNSVLVLIIAALVVIGLVVFKRKT